MQKQFIKNRNGEKIAVVVEEAQNPKGLAFVMHGLGGFKEQAHIKVFAEAFKEKGYNVVLFDTTNSIGESAGEYEDATTTNYYEDLEDVISWAKTQSWFITPFILCGHSLGGFCSAYYAQNYPEEVKAVAPIAPIISGELSIIAHGKKEIENWEKTGWRIRESATRPGHIKKLKWSHMEDRLKYDLLKNVDKLNMPVLLIVGENDDSVPSTHLQMLYDKLLCKKEFHIIKNAPHTYTDKGQLEEIKEIMGRWIEQI